jgi:hypothetical protein
MTMASTQLVNRIAFGLTGVVAVGSSGFLFRDLCDISQWVIKTDRDDVFWTFQHRHKLAALSIASSAANSAVWYNTKCFPRALWAAVNGTSLFLVYTGYVNPDIMMR